MSDVTVTQVARNFAEYVNRVAYRRESFTLVRGKKPLAELRPLPAGARLSSCPACLPPCRGCLRLRPATSPRICAVSRGELGEARDAWQS